MSDDDAVDGRGFAPVVIAFSTVGDGLVLRWYRSERAAEMSREVVSASRKGVAVDAFAAKDDVAALCRLIYTADTVASMIRRGRDVSTYVTHTKSWRGDLAEKAS